MSWRNRIAGMIEFVTDIVMDSDGVATSQGMDEDDKIDSVAGWNFGFYSRPKDSARGLVVKADGQGNTSVLLCVWDRQYELTLEKGEVGIASAFDASILLDQNGAIVLTAKTGQRVDINGSDYSAPKWEDFLVALKAFITTLKTVTNINASVVATAAATLETALTTATDFKSTKVKYG